MELKTKTESLDIPESWEQTPLANICTLYNGRAFHRSEWESQGTPVIRLQNLTGGDDYYYSTLKLPPSKYCSEGDLLYMWSATFGPTIWKGPKAIYHYHIWKVDVKNSIASKNFLYFKLSEITQRLKERETSGSTMLHLTKQKMEKTDVLLPPLPEQRAIADALSDVDALIERLDALIAKKRAIKTATMQRLLTGTQRLPGFDGDWTTKRLGEVTQIVNGGTPSSSVDAYWGGKIPWCTPTDITGTSGRFLSETERNITEKGLANSSATLLPKGSLLLCSRATVGEVKIATTPITTNQGFKSLICDSDTSNQYLYYLLLTMKSDLEEVSSGSTFLELSKRSAAALEITLPPLEEQKAIATILSDMDAEIEALQARRDKTQDIKQGMMQELLTGRTRLV
ncbi:restriction endonuclease subunit S [Longimonas halophila]|uniref:Restriction endonuclease subunit S n=1 Tax=Longimonas halophila TaxID=1469170 RepID=A0A2H3NR72_9BACT|nr:restriction endonuclease subunit S [Longimonas halophila]PEN09582.1 restriction endonuclease subunit S [Longimonas halophila]